MNYPSSNTWGVESAPLGTTNVTTLTEVNGFQTLANGGVYQQGYLIDSITDSTGKKSTNIKKLLFKFILKQQRQL